MGLRFEKYMRARIYAQSTWKASVLKAPRELRLGTKWKTYAYDLRA